MDGSLFPRTWRQKVLLVPLARGLKLYHRARVHGLDSVPADRPVVYAGKHPRTWLYLETMLLGLLSFWDGGRVPFRVLEQRRTSIHRTPGLGWIRRHVGAIEATEEAARRALRGGESVLVFPGGARELRGAPDVLAWHGRRGFARIAAAEGVPVVPFAIGGADGQHLARVALRRDRSLWIPPLPLPVPLDFWFGAPLDPPPPGDAAALDHFVAAAARETQALLERAAAARRAAWSLR